MKKIITAFLVIAMSVLCFAGCNNDPLNNNTPTTTSPTEATEAEKKASSISQKSYDETFDGLVSYFNDCKNINTEDENQIKEMDASLIGAEKGNRYTTKYNNADVVIELYSYKTDDLNDTAKDTISSVKNNGEFQIMKLDPVKAYLSNNGKYLMVYNDKSIDKSNPDKTTDNYKRMETVI